MIQVISVENMRESDNFTTNNLTTGLELMHRAAEGVFNCMPKNGTIAIVAGKGNNGGDGFALASILEENNIPCEIFIIEEKFSKDSKFYFEECKKAGLKINLFDDNTTFDDFDLVVDCLFGTGFIGIPYGKSAKAIEMMNKARYVVSVDINSGLNGDNGIAFLAVKSNLTVSIGYYKTGHFLNDAKDYIDELCNVDIAIKLCNPPYHLCEQQDFAPIFPERKHNTHKGNYGKTAILGGSLKYSGAIKLTSMSAAALKCGTGLSTIIVPETIASSLLPFILESTLCPIADDGKTMVYDEEVLKDALSGTSSLCLGMGWDNGRDNAKILSFILDSFSFPIVIDADGINTLAKMNLDILLQTRAKVILTPHIKEFSRLIGKEVEEIRMDSIGLCKSFANKYNVILLLKGATTLITDGKEVLLSNSGCAGMAKGGSGDVLSGIIAGLNAFSPNLFLNAAAGAFINGKAGEYAMAEKGEYSMTASDTVNNIYKVIKDITNNLSL